jgi:cytochrome P450
MAMGPIKESYLGSRAFKADPYPFYARLRAEEPVCRIQLSDQRLAWLVTRYDDVVSVLKDDRFKSEGRKVMTPEQLSRQPWVPQAFKPLMRTMLVLDPPDHTRLRGLVHKAFTPRLVEAMQRRIERLTEELLDAARARGRIDLIHDYALPLPTLIIAGMLGVPGGDWPRFHRWSRAIMTSTSSFWSTLTIVPHVSAFMKYLRKLVNARRADPRDDLTSALVQAREAGDCLSEDELLAMIFLLLVAGHETTVNLIGNGVLALLEHPAQMTRLRDEPEQIKPAVEELLRFDSPVQIANERYASEDLSIAGVTIARGEMVFPVVASANRDPAQFDRPDELDVAREPNRHLTFGLGVHYCLGAPLARLEGQIAINTLLAQMPDLHLAVPQEALRRRPGMSLHGFERLPLAFGVSRARHLQGASRT